MNSMCSDWNAMAITHCTVCYLRLEHPSGEWIHCFNSPVSLTCSALRLMGARLGLRLTGYASHCAYIWSWDRGSPHEMVKPCKEWMDLFKLSCSDKIQSAVQMELIISHPFTIVRYTLSFTSLCKPCRGYDFKLWAPCSWFSMFLIFLNFLMFT